MQVYSSEESDMLIVVNSDIFFTTGRQKERRVKHLHCGGIYLLVVMLGFGPRPNNENGKKRSEPHSPTWQWSMRSLSRVCDNVTEKRFEKRFGSQTKRRKIIGSRILPRNLDVDETR